MSLVEKSVLDHLRQKQNQRSLEHPVLNSILKIQEEIEEILKAPEKSDDDKVSLLKIAQARFNKLRGELGPMPVPALNGLPIPAPAPPIADEPLDLVPAAPVLLTHPVDQPHPRGHPQTIEKKETAIGEEGADPHAVVRLPTNFNKKFQALQKILKENRGLLSSNANEEMIIDGKPIIGSNFHDLIRCLYIPSQKYNLTGLSEFTLALYKAHINPDLFSNNQFLTIFKSLGSSLSNLSNPTKAKGLVSSISHGASSLSPNVAKSEDEGGQKGQGRRKRKAYLKSSLPSPPGKRIKILRIYR